MPRLAFQPDTSAHEVCELAADGQPQPRPAVAARRAAVRLREGLEDGLLAVLRDADPAVSDRKPDRGLRPGLGYQPRLDDHLAARRELQGVADEVRQDLPDAPRIAPQALGDSRRDVADQLDPCRLGARGQQVGDVLQSFAQAEVGHLDRHLARLDLGKVEDVIDDRQQRFAAAPDRFGVVALVRRQPGFQQKPGHADDAVHGRADLVAHVRQELGLRPRRGFRLVARPFQLARLRFELGGALDDPRLQISLDLAQRLLRPLVIVNVGAGAEPLDDVPLRIAHRHPAPQVPAVRAVFRPLEAVFRLVIRAGAERCRPARRRTLYVVGVQDGQPAPGPRLIEVHPCVVVPALVVIIWAAVHAGRPDDLRHGVGHEPEARLALTHGGLGPLLLGDILVDQDDLTDQAILVLHGVDEGLQPLLRPRAVRAALWQRLGGPARDVRQCDGLAAEAAQDVGHDALGDELLVLEYVVAREVPQSPPGQLGQGGVDPQRRPIRREDLRAEGRLLDQGPEPRL